VLSAKCGVQYVSSTAPAPLDGFRKATNLPRPKAWAMAGGTLAWARRPQTWVAGGSSNKILAISAVSPLGPGAAPRRARCKFVVKRVAGTCTGLPVASRGWQSRWVHRAAEVWLLGW